MNVRDAAGVVESLRKGLPPIGNVRQFTVGRQAEIRSLGELLKSHDGGALLLEANYGSGKSHLLRYIQEEALEQGYAISNITVDSKSEARFNRMDQIAGAVCSGLRMPDVEDQSGIRSLFESVVACGRLENLTDLPLESELFRYCLRNWLVQWDGEEGRRQCEDMLEHSWNYPRTGMRNNKYAQSWSVIEDIDTMVRHCGCEGLVLLFDEFEDVITNLGNIKYQEAAFKNLFRFYSGDYLSCTSFFAVTPEFSRKCRALISSKGSWDFEVDRFDDLKKFSMSPLTEGYHYLLAQRIAEVYAKAFDWKKIPAWVNSDLMEVVLDCSGVKVQDRTRQTIKQIMQTLDQLDEELQ